MSEIDSLLENMDLAQLVAHRMRVDVMISEFHEKRKKAALAAAEEAAGKFGVKLSELFYGGADAGKTKRTYTKRKDTDESAKAKAPPMYRNPEDESVTWSGKGKPPNWIKNFTDRTAFLVK